MANILRLQSTYYNENLNIILCHQLLSPEGIS